MNFDQDLVRARDGIGDVREPDMVGDRAIAVEKKRPHAPSCGVDGFYNTAKSGDPDANFFGETVALPALDLNAF